MERRRWRQGCRSRAPVELAAEADDRYLSRMSLRIFRAGLKHSLVDAKWPAFEEAFAGFEPRRVRAMSDEALEGLLADKRLIRHWRKEGVNRKINMLVRIISL